MTAPKKHHFLPQFYLKQFKVIPQSGRNPKIGQIEKTTSPNPKRVSIKDAGCKTDYHTLDIPDQEKDRKSIEKIFSKLETTQANLIREICETNQISEEAKPSLADFITTMRYRTPYFKKFIERHLKGAVQSTYKILMHQKKLPPLPKILEKDFRQKGYDCIVPIISNWKIMQYMLERAFSSEDSALLKEMKWKLILTPSEYNFITGDTPVSIYHPNYKAIRPYGVNIAFRDIEVTFPISKKHLVKLTWNGKDESLQAQKNQVAEYNRRTIIMAEKYVFTSETSPHLKKQIVRFHNLQAGYKIDDMWYGEGAVQIARFIPVTDE